MSGNASGAPIVTEQPLRALTEDLLLHYLWGFAWPR